MDHASSANGPIRGTKRKRGTKLPIKATSTSSNEANKELISNAGNAATKLSPPFLTLPPELRNRIYELALVDCKPILFRSERYEELYGRLPDNCVSYTPPAASLLAANEQIRRKAQSIYYGNNTFIFDARYEVYSFLRALGPVKRQLLSQIQVNFILGTDRHMHLNRKRILLQTTLEVYLVASQEGNVEAHLQKLTQELELSRIEDLEMGSVAEKELANAGLHIPDGTLRLVTKEPVRFLQLRFGHASHLRERGTDGYQ